MIRKVFPILALSIFSSMLGIGIIVPLLPIYAESLGATGLGLGFIVASFSLTRGIVMPFVGKLSDQHGRKVFITVGLFIYAVVSLGYIFSDNPMQLTLVRLIHGVASGMILPVAQAYIGEIAPDNEAGKWMGYFNAAFIGGFGFGPLMGGALSDRFGMNVAFISMGGLNMAAFLIAIFLLPEVSTKQSRASSPRLSIREIRQSGVVKGLFSFRLMFDVGMGVVFTFLPLFTSLSLGLTSSETGILLAVYILLMSSLQPLSGRFADRFNQRKLVIIGGLIGLGSLALVPGARSFGHLLGLSALGGIGGALALPATSALMVQEGRRYGMGLTISVVFLAISMGAVIGPILGGLIIDKINMGSVFYFAAIMGLLGTGTFARFTR